MRGVLREETRDGILDAAGRMVERYGYRKTTMSDIAREAGVGKATLYLYFESKQDLALAYVARVAGRVQDALREVAASPQPAAERLRRMLVLRVEMGLLVVSNMRQSLDELFADLRRPLFEQRRRQEEAEGAILAGVVDEGMAAGEFARAEPAEAAMTLLCATGSLMPYSLSREEIGDPGDIAAQAGRVADMLLAGLLRR